jgi:hypothetical protein
MVVAVLYAQNLVGLSARSYWGRPQRDLARHQQDGRRGESGATVQKRVIGPKRAYGAGLSVPLDAIRLGAAEAAYDGEYGVGTVSASSPAVP